MNLDTKLTFTITLTAAEMRLVVAALYGGLKPDQRDEALALQKLIVAARATQAAHLAREAQKYADNLEGS